MRHEFERTENERTRRMISYAQNFEDVMLARAFRAQQGGFYIDVGAWDDTLDSVTKHFYDRGWRGINVEPVGEMFEQLERTRPRDINLRAAILDEPGAAMLYRIPRTGLSTFVMEQAEEHRRNGWEVVEEKIPVTTLRTICAEHVGDRTIDFLKVDTEGTEYAVLKGGDWARYRPRVIVVEATRPLSQEPTHREWEPYLLENGYVAAYFDGINRFYVRAEEANLLTHFNAPPNLFDNFVIYRSVKPLWDERDSLKRRLASAMQKADAWDRWRGTLLGRVVAMLHR